ncbi:MAG TPA: hypothetical protein VD884_15705 [Ohtaekwangia sp.]|nr:hypothetical protein [Ohtaekwangia sp.]
MDYMISTFDNKVDYYLHKISMAPNLTMKLAELYEVPVLDEETYLLDQIMLEKGLLKISKDARVISSKGLEISNFGGWLIYKKQWKKEHLAREVNSPALKRHTLEIENLQKEIATLKQELTDRKDQEATSLLIKNLLKQNRNNTLLFLLSGFLAGYIIANLKWIVDLLINR